MASGVVLRIETFDMRLLCTALNVPNELAVGDGWWGSLADPKLSPIHVLAVAEEYPYFSMKTDLS
jgi:hypothetical protein